MSCIRFQCQKPTLEAGTTRSEMRRLQDIIDQDHPFRIMLESLIWLFEHEPRKSILLMKEQSNTMNLAD